MSIRKCAARAALAGAVLVSAAASAVAAPAARPNIVMFVTDDESWLERSAYGWSQVPTPHFDRVAREGVLFTRGFASAPSCAPARAALLTGRNFWELEQGAFIQAWLPAKFPTLPDLMEAGGYRAGYSGKGWGPGTLEPSGRKRNPAGDAYNSVKRPQREDGIGDIDYPANLAKFLDGRPAGTPFWFWVGSVEPHAPLGRDNHLKLESRYGMKEADVRIPGFLPPTPGVRRQRANLAYETCHADRDLGRVLQVLEERGELANTLLIVTADNGTETARGKTNLYDWGVRVPLAMMWPARVKGGRTVDDFVNFADLAPTMLEAAGLPVPAAMSGRSVLEILKSGKAGRVDPARSWTVTGLEWHGEEPPANLAGRAIRDERYLYIVNYGEGPRSKADPTLRRPDSEYAASRATDDALTLVAKHPEHPEVKPYTALFTERRPREELYDSETDPWQTTNLAESPAHLAIRTRLKAQLEAYQRRTGDPRATGDMALFEATRARVLDRKFGEGGYGRKRAARPAKEGVER